MAYGLTDSGFNRKRLADIKLELETDYKLIFGDNIDLSPQSVFGQIIGIHSLREADIWELGEAVYNANYPSTAQGTQLSNVVEFNGIVRQEATYSLAVVTCTGTNATVIPAGSLIETSDTKIQFVSTVDATITGGTVDVQFRSVEKGAFEAVAGTLTVIDTPVFGWATANNTNDATIGENEETDAELRDRRTLSTQALGQNLGDALFGQLNNIVNVTSALVISNGTDETDANGIPAHQFMAVVDGGLEADIVDAVWKNTPQGIASYGTSSAIIVDSQGFNQQIFYSRPTGINIFFKITITTDGDFAPSGSDDLKTAVANYGSTNFLVNDDVLISKFYNAINTIPGITSVDLRIGLSASPTGTVNLPIAVDEISKYDTTRIEVVIS